MNGTKPVRILYMEDDAGLARLFQRRLEREGYIVDLAPDGDAGLAKYREGSYRVLCVDHKMPKKNGLDVIRVLASAQELPPTIMITGAGDETVAVEAMKLGATDYIIKDVEMRYLELLPSVIERALAKQRLIEEKQLAENALGMEQEKFRTMIEHAPVGMVLVDGDGTFKYMNPMFKQMFGYDINDAPHFKQWRAMVFPGMAERHQVIAAWVDNMREVATGECRFTSATALCKDGTRKVIHFIPAQLNTGEYILTCEDISDRKKAEEELMKSENRFRSLFESAMEFIYMLDTEGRITQTNPAALRRLGYSEMQMVGRRLTGFLSSASRRDFPAPLVKMLEEDAIRGEMELVCKDGSTVTVDCYAAAIHDSHDRITSIVVFQRDVTGRKRAHQAMEIAAKGIKTVMDRAGRAARGGEGEDSSE